MALGMIRDDIATARTQLADALDEARSVMMRTEALQTIVSPLARAAGDSVTAVLDATSEAVGRRAQLDGSPANDRNDQRGRYSPGYVADARRQIASDWGFAVDGNKVRVAIDALEEAIAKVTTPELHPPDVEALVREELGLMLDDNPINASVRLAELVKDARYARTVLGPWGRAASVKWDRIMWADLWEQAAKSLADAGDRTMVANQEGRRIGAKIAQVGLLTESIIDMTRRDLASEANRARD